MKILNFLYIFGHFCPPWSGSRSETLNFSDLINFQYYIEVVPTVVDSYLGSKVSYQYSVKVWKKKWFLLYYFIIIIIIIKRTSMLATHLQVSLFLTDPNPHSCQIWIQIFGLRENSRELSFAKLFIFLLTRHKNFLFYPPCLLPVLRIRDVFPGSRIRFFFPSRIPDPGLKRFGTRIRNKIIKVF